VDQQPNSPSFGEEISPSSLGKPSLWGYYWANCGTCEQQFAHLQTLKDELSNEGFDVEIVGVLYRDSGLGRFGTTPRDSQGACMGSRASYPSCTENPGQITLSMPVVVNAGEVATLNGVEARGSWFIYRADGRLHEFIESEELETRNGFLGDQPNWDLLKGKLKAAAYGPSQGCFDQVNEDEQGVRDALFQCLENTRCGADMSCAEQQCVDQFEACQAG
jgi:hypothetical protein